MVGETVADRYAQVEALIGRELASDDDEHGVAAGMRRLCGAAGRALSASGAGLTVMADGGLRGVTAASDAATERLEELQLTLGEGPCIDAYGSMRPVLIPDLGDGAMARWPVYAPAVHAEGVRAVFAFPLQIGAARLGVMDVFRTEAGMLSPDELTLALTFAEVAVSTLLDGHDNTRVGVADDWLDDPLGSRAELFQAQGMVMVQLRVSLAEAMVRMRAHAYVHDLRLYDVAADVVARRLSFDTPQP
ncbi:GAF and ANTAR domain-containing protein [Catellatospora paridis]|uniref:GAF and ANTAR domain-containing protein n=1 Tax=Catellatospora paridis TaxID=1617086 RepID=UPI0012D4C35B|nr:GAF and ANTAR domain-containing protein [Catellatospora paridis]